MTLRSTQNEYEREEEVQGAWDINDAIHENAKAVYEHGQWWINCGACGAQWSVDDASGPGSVDGFSFEQVSQGDESCFENALESDGQ